LEEELNNVFYKLYNFTYDEVKVLDSEFPSSKKEYENISIE